jgi:hypothetical protein
MKPPTAAQLRYLRGLAVATGTTFTPPRTRAQASREIDRLKTRPVDAHADRARERHQVQADLAQAPQDAVRFRREETSGYGSNCQWSHSTRGPKSA